MRRGAGIRHRFAVTITVIMAASLAPSAQASTDDIIAPSDPNNPEVGSGWQAGTCTTDAPTKCSVATPAQFFETAAGHPQKGFTQFILSNEPPGETPIGELKTVHVDLPVGLSVNPGATPQCEQEDLETNEALCAEALVGQSEVTVAPPPLGLPLELSPVNVYNIVPQPGEPARFGFALGPNFVYLRANVAWDGDYHEGFTIDVPPAPSFEPLFEGGLVLKNRLVFNGRAGDGTFITTPSTCFGEAVAGPFLHAYSTYLLASSVEEEEEEGYEFPASAQPPLESRIPPNTSPKECDSIPFDPSIEVDPQTTLTDSPSGAAVQVNLPHEDESLGTTQETSHLRHASVTLPAGMGLNPSAANGLEACTDAQFGKGTTAPVACPAASKVGTVTVETPPLPEGPLTGEVYVGQQLSRDPSSGQQYRIFVDAESARYGISARLIGNVSANPQTGQLTTTFAENPQVPFSSFLVDFDDGAKAALTSPPTCGPNLTTTAITPWSTAPGQLPAGEEGGPSDNPPATPGDEFSLTDAPGGGKCAETMAARPFAPGFGAKPDEPRAAAFTPFEVDLTRSDGNQELKVVDIVLPPGHTAKLAGLRYCPEEAIAAAAANSGAAEAATPSCPASSRVGSAAVRVGSGPDPIQIEGKAFLAGPYKGAPLSLVFVTPATAGPFDLGSVVVRVALFVHPETAQIHAVSDPIPHVFGGALIDLRSAVVRTDRRNFSLNPTNCSPHTAGGTLRGGGANPLDPAAFSAFSVSTTVKVNGCERLGFKPKLRLRVFGGTRRAKNPKLRATFVAREGDANVGRAAVSLPRPFFLDQASLAKVCTRVQFAADDCPKNSIYGYARATTPLLDGPLKGPVYLRSSDNVLPDLVARLRGQVEVHLVGRTDSVKGRIRNTFDVLPDVPVSKFTLTVRGGKKGLLVNSQNLCKLRPKQLRAIARFKGQNGKKANMRPRLRTPCGTRDRH
jgi:hypothetical protein